MVLDSSKVVLCLLGHDPFSLLSSRFNPQAKDKYLVFHYSSTLSNQDCLQLFRLSDFGGGQWGEGGEQHPYISLKS